MFATLIYFKKKIEFFQFQNTFFFFTCKRKERNNAYNKNTKALN